MKTKSLLTFVLLAAIYSSVFGQEPITKPVKKISIHDFYIQLGMFANINNFNGTYAEFKTLAPQSVLLNNNLTDYSTSDGFGWSSSTMFSAMLGLQFSDKQNTAYKTNPLLRLGISYITGTNLTGNFYREDHKPYDTLTSAQTGNTIYLDSVNTKSYNTDYSSEQLRFDCSLIFRTNPEARWSLYAGIGLTAGVSMNANTTISYFTFDGTATRDQNGFVSNQNNASGANSFISEKFRNKNNVGVSTYIPLGIDFRLGKKNELSKQIHLFYEFRPGINIASIPNLRTVTNASMQHGLGLRVSWK